MKAQTSDIKVSVIVATYNQEQTIARTLESIVAQQCGFRYEIVIGEDCSTDNTLDICRHYARLYPDKIVISANPVNKGLRDNYYDCILQCRGEYIADCAGDDYWIDSFKLRKQAELLDAHPDVTLVHTDWEFVDSATGQIRQCDPGNRKSKFRKPFMSGRDLLLPLLNHEASPIIHLCTAMYRKSSILKAYNEDSYTFRNPDFPCEDLQLIAALASMGDIAFLPDTTLRYSVGNETISGTAHPAKSFDFYFGAFKLTDCLAGKYRIDKTCLDHYAADTLQFIMAQAFNSVDSVRRQKLMSFVKTSRYPVSTKFRLMIFLSSWKPLWRLCASLNKIQSTI